MGGKDDAGLSCRQPEQHIFLQRYTGEERFPALGPGVWRANLGWHCFACWSCPGQCWKIQWGLKHPVRTTASGYYVLQLS